MTEHRLMPAPATRIALDALPELPTQIGMAGAMRHAEVGGSACSESGIIIVTIAVGMIER